MTVRKLMVVVGADLTVFQAKMGAMQKDLTKISKQAEKSIGPVMDKIGTAVKLMGAAAATGFGAMAVAGVKMNAQLEQSKIAFTTMLGSAEAANSFLEQMRDFAEKTPFEFNELQGAAKKMLAFGFSAQQVIPMMTSVGDAVAGLGGGQEMIDRVTLALGQMQAKGKVSAQEMMQLAEAGIPAWQMLADKFGMTTAEVMKLSEKGLIPAGKAIAALTEGMDKRFGGMMEQQSKTMLGVFSTLKDISSRFITDVTGPMFEKAKVKLDEFRAKIDVWRKSGQLEEWAEKAQRAFTAFWNVGEKVVSGLIASGQFIAAHWGVIEPILGGVLAGFLAFKAATIAVNTVKAAMLALNLVMAANPIGLVTLAVAGLATAGVYLYRNWDEVKVKMAQVWEAMRASGEAVVIAIGTGWNNLKLMVYGVIDGLLDKIAPFLEWLPGSLGRGFEQMRAAVKDKMLDVSLNLNLLAERGADSALRLGEAWDGVKMPFNQTATVAAAATAKMAETSKQAAAAVAGASNVITTGLEGVGEKAKAAAEETRAAWEIAIDKLHVASGILRAQFETVTAGMGDVSQTSQRLREELDYLGKEKLKIADRIDVLDKEYRRLLGTKGEDAEETQKQYLLLMQENQALAENGARIKDTTKAMKDHTAEIKKQREELADLGRIADQAYSSAFQQALTAAGKGLIGVDQVRSYATSVAREQGGTPEALWENLKSTYYAAPLETLKHMYRTTYGMEAPAAVSSQTNNNSSTNVNATINVNGVLDPVKVGQAVQSSIRELAMGGAT